MVVQKVKCGECKYWVEQGIAGECHRYPAILVKYAVHWCGEFVVKNNNKLCIYNYCDE